MQSGLFVSHIDVSEADVTDLLNVMSEELREAADLDVRLSGASHHGLPVSFDPYGGPFLVYTIGWNREHRLRIRQSTRILTFAGQLLQQSRGSRGGRAFLTRGGVSSCVDGVCRQLGTWNWPGDGPDRRVQSLIVALRNRTS